MIIFLSFSLSVFQNNFTSERERERERERKREREREREGGQRDVLFGEENWPI